MIIELRGDILQFARPRYGRVVNTPNWLVRDAIWAEEIWLKASQYGEALRPKEE